MHDEFAELKALVVMAERRPNDPLPTGVSEAELTAMEFEFPGILSEDLREWLMTVNGSFIGGGGVLGFCKHETYLDIREVLRLHPHWIIMRWCPVACDGCGNFYVIVNDDNRWPVAFIDTAEDPDRLTYLVASSLRIFLRRFIESESGTKGWPFDKDYVLQHDPSLSCLTIAPMPWD